MEKVKVSNRAIAKEMAKMGYPITEQAVGKYRKGKLLNPETAAQIQAAEIRILRNTFAVVRDEYRALQREVQVIR